MKFHVMTLFPEMIEDATKVSILGRAINNDLISIDAIISVIFLKINI